MSRAAEWRLAERVGTLFAQLFFIAAGVYLGNRADAWKEARGHREAARAALVNFRTELRTNRAQVATVQPYHARLGRSFMALQADSAPRPRSVDELFTRVHWDGMHPVAFRHTAWDLALANQSLGYVEPGIAFRVADVYMTQRGLEDFQQTTLQNSLSPASLRSDAVPGLALMLMVFLQDASHSVEPQLLRQYDALLPQLDSAIARMPR